MSGIAGQQFGNSLASTLALALTQCQDQVRQLEEQGKAVEDLKRENEQLRQELEKSRAKLVENVETKYKAQFQDVFKQVAQKQSEVDRLKEKLRAAKLKANRRGLVEPISSSPAYSAGNIGPLSPQKSPLSILPSFSDRDTETVVSAKKQEAPHGSETTVSRKRQRSQSPRREPLQEIPANVQPVTVPSIGERSVKSKRRAPADRDNDTISVVAEDGDDYKGEIQKHKKERKSDAMPAPIDSRLDSLLKAPASRKSLLLRAQSSSPVRKQTILPEATPARSVSSAHRVPLPTSGARFKRPRSLAGSRKASNSDLKDVQLLRTKPIDDLELMHFKLNPATNSGLDYAFSEVTRGENRKCLPGCTRVCCTGTFKALASTMPQFANQTGKHFSDHELLLGFLGHGSEERISKLTPKARENLLHEAKTKLVADTYGKIHRDAHERGRSPPGFWRTDMPRSQESREDLALAKAAEREEVSRRYNEALKHGGRWIFADE